MAPRVLEVSHEPLTRIYPMRLEQYHQMIQGGILPEGEPYELLDGQIVAKDRSAPGEDPMTVGHDHAACVDAIAELNSGLGRSNCYIRIQQPLSLPPFDEPEPDAAIVRAPRSRYATRHPGAADVLAVIEVSDASLQRDRTTKLRIYARAGVRAYFIVNLVDRVIEQYLEPLKSSGRYGEFSTFSASDSVMFPVAKGKGLAVPVRQILPSPSKPGGRGIGHRR